MAIANLLAAEARFPPPASRFPLLPFAKGELVDFERANLPFERLAWDAELRRRAAWAGNTSLGFCERGLDQFLLAGGERGHGSRGSIRDLAPLARKPRVVDGESL